MSVILWFLVGVCWHILFVSIGHSVEEALSLRNLVSWMCLFGGLTGVLAGAFTIWSRRRRQGREGVGWVFATYYLAMAVYWLGLVVARALTHWGRGEELPPSFVERRLADLEWIVVYGTFYGVVLIPLCWLTRHLVWRAHVRLRPN